MRSLLFWLFFYSPVDSVTLPDPRCSFTVCVWAKVAVLKVRAGNYVFANTPPGYADHPVDYSFSRLTSNTASLITGL